MGSERDTDDVLVERPISVPADARPRIVADQQRLSQFFRVDAGEPCGPSAERFKPIRDRSGQGQLAGIEIVARTVGRGEALAFPAVELERR